MAWVIRALPTLARRASLFVLLAGALLWAASYWRQATFFYQSPHRRPFGHLRQVDITFIRGKFHASYLEDLRKLEFGRWMPGARWVRLKPIDEPWGPPHISDLWQFLWVNWYQEYPNRQGHVRQWTLRVPIWAVLAPFAILPASSVIARVRRSRRRRRGQCINCGYDVRSSSQRCPECGAALGARADQPTAPGE